MKFLKEFKEFAVKGNVVDMSIGVIIGGAFGKIVTSLVNDVIMPLLSIIIGKIDISDLKIAVSTSLDGSPITLNYGMFLQNVLDFLIIAMSIFVVVKLITSRRKKVEEPEPEPEKPTQEELLTGILESLQVIEGSIAPAAAEASEENNQ